jgi:transcriptional regulator with XRE-family HTH domain
VDGVRKLKTRVFDVARARGLSNYALARAMGVSLSQVGRVEREESGFSRAFMVGALRAFPDLSLDDLFYQEEEVPATA